MEEETECLFTGFARHFVKFVVFVHRYFLRDHIYPLQCVSDLQKYI